MDSLALTITDFDPINQAVFDTANWYEWQTCDLTDSAQLPWLFAQGWTIADTEVVLDDDTGRYTTIWWQLRRRVLKPELALQDLMQTFTDAYNDGRILNDQRYDDIVAIYQATLQSSETDLIALQATDNAYDDLIEAIITNIGADFTAHNSDVENDLDDYGDSERDRIDVLFDAKIAAAKQSLIERGLYNTSVWSSIEAGYERERAVADTDLEDKIIEVQLRHKERLYQFKTEMRSKILAARDRMRESLHQSKVQRVTVRNAAVEVLAKFMERREDAYPDIAAIGNLAAGLGTSSVAYPAP